MRLLWLDVEEREGPDWRLFSGQQPAFGRRLSAVEVDNELEAGNRILGW